MEKPPDEKIQILEEMGISKNQAIKALMKYNNDVGRAANYIFSEDIQTEDDEPPPLIKLYDTQNSQVTTIEVEGPEPANESFSLLDDGQMIETIKPDSNITGFTQQGLEAAFANNEQRQLTTALANSLAKHNRSTNNLINVASSDTVQTNSSSLALIPYSQAAQEHNKFVPQLPSRTYASAPRKPLRYWTDPHNPLERQRVNDGAIGLQPRRGEHYINPFLQTLFHIPIIRQAVLAYRPIPNEWGDMDDYWKGSWEPFFQGMLGKTREDKYLAVLYELQKLFGYMHLTKRAYGSSKDFSDILWSNALENKSIDFRNFLSGILEQFSNVSTLQAFDARGNFVHDLQSLFQNEVWKDSWVTNMHNGEQVYETGDKDSFKYMIFDICPSDTTIYAALDRIFYDSNQDASQLVYITHMADVFILCLERQYHDWTQPQYKDLHIDQVFYPSRYSQVRKNEIVQRMSSMRIWLKEIEQVREELNFLNIYQGSLKGEDLLRSSHEYFESMETESSQILAIYLAKALEDRQSRVRGLESRLAELEQIQFSVFDGAIESDPYYLRAVLVNEGSLSSDQHVAYIWVPQLGGQGRWMRFADADVEVVLEERVLYDRLQGPLNLGVYGLVYTRAGAEENMDEVLAGLDRLIPENLRIAIEKDNEAFAIEIQKQVQRDLEETSQGLNNLGGGVEENQGTNFGENTHNTSWSDNYLSESQNSVLPQTLLHTEGVGLLIKSANKVTSEDYRVLQRFEFFLSKIQNFMALEMLVKFYVDRDLLHEDPDEPLAINAIAEKDEHLQFAFKAFTIYKDNSEIFIKALQCIGVDDYHRAIDWLVDLKQKDMIWVNRYAENTEAMQAVPRPDAVSRKEQIDKYGKFCLKILNNEAYQQAMDPIYVSRGLEAGVRLAGQAISLLGEDNLNDDPVMSNIREQWLNYDHTGLFLDQGQSEHIKIIVMLLVGEMSVDKISPHLASVSLGVGVEAVDVREIREGLGFDDIQIVTDMELWKRYQKAIDSADEKLTPTDEWNR